MNALLDWTEARLAKSWARIRQTTACPLEALGLFRVFFGVFILLFYTPYVSWIQDTPQELFAPPRFSAAGVFQGFPSGIILNAYDLVAPVLLLLLTLGLWSRWVGLASAILFFFFNSFVYSYGKIDHDVLPWAALMCLSFSGWGERVALRRDRPLIKCGDYDGRHSLGLLGVFIAFGMFTAGLEKAINWVDFDLGTNGFYGWFYAGYFGLQRDFLLADAVFHTPPWFAEINDYLAVLFEISGFLFLFAGRKSWRGWLLVVCAFHLLTTLTLNISFHANVLAYSCFFVGFVVDSKVYAAIRAWFSRQHLLVVCAVPALLTITHLATRLVGQGGRFLFINDFAREREVNVRISVVIWALTIVTGAAAMWMEARRKRMPTTESLPAMRAGESVQT